MGLWDCRDSGQSVIVFSENPRSERCLRFWQASHESRKFSGGNKHLPPPRRLGPRFRKGVVSSHVAALSSRARGSRSNIRRGWQEKEAHLRHRHYLRDSRPTTVSATAVALTPTPTAPTALPLLMLTPSSAHPVFVLSMLTTDQCLLLSCEADGVWYVCFGMYALTLPVLTGGEPPHRERLLQNLHYHEIPTLLNQIPFAAATCQQHRCSCCCCY